MGQGDLAADLEEGAWGELGADFEPHTRRVAVFERALSKFGEMAAAEFFCYYPGSN